MWKRVRVVTQKEKLQIEQNTLDAIHELAVFREYSDGSPPPDDGSATVRSIAQRHGINRQTLSRRYDEWERAPWATAEVGLERFAMGPPSVLTKVEEDELARQCIAMANRGFGLTLDAVKATVSRIVADGRPHNFGESGPGKEWWAGFKRRNPQVAVKEAQLLEYHRHNQLTRKVIDKMYDTWEELCIETYGSVANVPPENVWNWDEKPLAMMGRQYLPRLHSVLLGHYKEVYLSPRSVAA